MKVKVRVEPKGEHKTINIEAGSTIEDLIAKFEKDIKYSVVYAKMNNSLVELTAPIKENSEVEILDIRTQAANLIYQNSLALIYLRAIDEVLPGAKVVIDNALNKGLYTEIKADHKVTQADINKIDKAMRRLIELDLPFNKETLTRETALEYFKDQGLESRLRMLESNPNVQKVHIFSLDGYKDFLYKKRISMQEYINETKRSFVVFNTPSVAGCHGWKLPEYLCMGKAIISTPLSREMPGEGLVHGENIHIVNSTEEIREAISQIRDDKTYRQRLMEGAKKYYEDYLAPEVVIQRIIDRCEQL